MKLHPHPFPLQAAGRRADGATTRFAALLVAVGAAAALGLP